jgi:DNA adenine methylase
MPKSDAVEGLKRPIRPPLRYHGGKWRLAPWIIANMPKHDVYVESFGGGASVLMRKDRIGPEVYNDLDGRVVQVFRALQDPSKAEQICARLEVTPYARAEFERCYEQGTDEIDTVCKTIMLSHAGFGSDSITRDCRTGFRTKLTDRRANPSNAWARLPEQIASWVLRLQGVVIEQRDALEVICQFDHENTLHFVDPPYVISTRSNLIGKKVATHGYRHEMDDLAHMSLAASLRSVKGSVMLCGYSSGLYEDLYRGWHRIERSTYADGARPRTECLWFNSKAWSERAG